MQSTPSKDRGAKSESDSIIIPKEILDALDKMPEKRNLDYKLIDKVILKYHVKRSATQIASALKRCVSLVSKRMKVLGVK